MGQSTRWGFDMKLSFRSLLVAGTVAALIAGPVAATRAQVPDLPRIPDPPQPPSQAQPLVNVVSPFTYQACLAQSNAAAVVQVVSTVAPVPVQPNDVIDPLRNLLLLDIVCGYFQPTVVPPRCGVDETIYGSLPADVTVLTVPQPSSIVATEVLAIQKALVAQGVPVQGQLTGPVNSQLGCHGGR